MLGARELLLHELGLLQQLLQVDVTWIHVCALLMAPCLDWDEPTGSGAVPHCEEQVFPCMAGSRPPSKASGTRPARRPERPHHADVSVVHASETNVAHRLRSFNHPVQSPERVARGTLDREGD
ncbi:hypothetical protein GCM10009560_11340 [Nonomuraea longicatena]|uniref:Secreted protein n=1 Tax=Nonomuraea longicatena TaxID=83682 RepID=A0ABN1NTS7_9ACTN